MSEYKTVGSFYGKQQDIRTFKEDNDWVLPATMIGIEIELEGFSKYPKFNGPQYWEQKEDGSLRNVKEKIPIEFVFASPLCGYDLTRALSLFNETITALKEKPFASPRTSTHVHLDVREITFNQLLNLIIMYTVVERPLYKYCGIQREENNFCLPFYKAEGLVFEKLYAKDIIGSADELASVSAGQNRYNGLNVCALRKFGTLEFRQLPGTFNIALISRWINIIMCLKKAAIEYQGNLFTLPTTFSETGIRKQVEKIFGNYFSYLAYPEMEYDVLLGIRLAQDILYRNEKYDSEAQINKIMSLEQQIESVYSIEIKKKLKLPKTKSKKNKEPATYVSQVVPGHFAFLHGAGVAVEQNNAEAPPQAEIDWNLRTYVRLFNMGGHPRTGQMFNNNITQEIRHVSDTVVVHGINCVVILVENFLDNTLTRYLVDNNCDVYSIDPQ